MIEVHGLAVPVNRAGVTSRGREFFAPGAFGDTVRSGRVQARINHASDATIATQQDQTLVLAESDLGLMFGLRITDPFWEAILVKAVLDGTLHGCSAGWDEDRERRRAWTQPGATYVIESVDLDEVTLCIETWPVFTDTHARVTRVAG